jgi:hypothetical protein
MEEFQVAGKFLTELRQAQNGLEVMKAAHIKTCGCSERPTVEELSKIVSELEIKYKDALSSLETHRKTLERGACETREADATLSVRADDERAKATRESWEYTRSILLREVHKLQAEISPLTSAQALLKLLQISTN